MSYQSSVRSVDNPAPAPAPENVSEIHINALIKSIADELDRVKSVLEVQSLKVKALEEKVYESNEEIELLKSVQLPQTPGQFGQSPQRSGQSTSGNEGAPRSPIRQPNVCVNFNTREGCKFGKRCHFLHVL